MNDQKPQIFDSKTLLALLLTGVIFTAWQFYMSKKYPPQTQATEVAKEAVGSSSNQEAAVPTTEVGTQAQIVGVTQNQVEARAVEPEKLLGFSNDKVSFQISNYGFSVRNFEIKQYRDDKGQSIIRGDKRVTDLFALFYGDRPVVFDIKELAPGNFEGIARIGETEIRRILKLGASNFDFESKVEVTNATEDFRKVNLEIRIPDEIRKAQSSSFLFPSFQHQDFIHVEFDKTHLINIDRSKENLVSQSRVAHLIGIGTQYFAVAAMDKSAVAPSLELQSNVSNGMAHAKLVYGEIRGQSSFSIENVLFVGPKSYDILKALDERFVELMDYGMFAFIAKPMLFAMKWFHGLVGNWGIAIILLTILVRFLVLPLYLMSVRSMRGMQRIQPRMKELQERYKNDPMTMNKEVWALMKEEKASPFGGCLPMLLQIPIFFALYRVISTSIELHQSPFIWWINDLSAYDHFFVLPVLMGVTMFIQQKITPTNMDPAQAKILLYMPLIFTVFMVSLPSGLTLYMFVSSLFGIIQQLILVPPAKPQNT